MRLAHGCTALAAVASGLGLLAPGAAAQVPAVQLPAVAADAVQPAAAPETAVQSAIPQQYHAIAKAVEQAVPAVAAPAPVVAAVATPAPRPPAAPEYHPPKDRYHSEPAPDVTVTQQPQNVNVSIRINSPGDDGPVVQINGAGNDVVVHPPAPKPVAPVAPAPDTPPAGALPDDWTWIWTSACFGGQPAPAGLASADHPGWVWRWSCDPPPVPQAAPVALPPGFFPAMGPAAARPRPHPRPERAHAARAAPPRASPPVTTGLTAAGPRVLAAAAPAVAVASRAARVVRRAVEAKARPAKAASDFPPGAGGVSAGAASGLGAAMSLLLGTWLAALLCASLLVIPRIWLRRWSGPPWRWPFAHSSRLERPG